MTLQTSVTVNVSNSYSSINTATQGSVHRNHRYRTTFEQLVEAVARYQIDNQPSDDLQETHFTISLTGEESQFTRFNQAKVRQSGHVRDAQIKLTLISCHRVPAQDDSDSDNEVHQDGRTASTTIPFTGDFDVDWPLTQSALTRLQQELPLLPVDPYIVLPLSAEADNIQRRQTQTVLSGHLLNESDIANALLKPVHTLDFSGFYAGGLSYRAYADSAGKRHWFETPSFTLDYSLFGGRAQEAVKGTFAGVRWQQTAYEKSIEAAAKQLTLLTRPVKALPRGSYRTYLAPAAVADIIDIIVWGGGLGEAALRQGNSAFGKLEKGEGTLSEQFSLGEDFQRTSLPRFNSSGEIAPARLSLIEGGRWKNSLVSGRSAKEYGKPSNGANEEEAMRAPTVAPGTLKEKDILNELGTGLYISNLHYLNWSDLTAGRITGMTRYACFWVEEGEIVAPIENLRFDDDLYRFLGEGLIGLTDQQTFIPAVSTYDRRSLGGMWVPGMLIDQFRYTL